MPQTDRIDEIIADQERLDAQTAPRVPFKLYDIPVLILFLVLFGVVFLQFFTRYVLNDSIGWTEELARYLLISMTFVGVIKSQLIDSHIRLDFIDSYVGSYARHLKIFALFATTFFAGFCVWSLWGLTSRTSFQKMVSMPFPKYYLYAVILAALTVLTLVAVVQFIRSLRGISK
jgi:TRAP-type C4-dicarboxylate transport system permease small subunit